MGGYLKIGPEAFKHIFLSTIKNMGAWLQIKTYTEVLDYDCGGLALICPSRVMSSPMGEYDTVGELFKNISNQLRNTIQNSGHKNTSYFRYNLVTWM